MLPGPIPEHPAPASRSGQDSYVSMGGPLGGLGVSGCITTPGPILGGRLKQHYRMGKCYLKGELGDQINFALVATAYYLRKWIRLRVDFFSSFIKVVKNAFPIILLH